MGRKNYANSAQFLAIFALAAACSSGGSLKPVETTESSPAIINPRVSAQVIQLSPDLKHSQAPNILADIKDVNNDVDDVRLQISLVRPQQSIAQGFAQAPFEVPMKHIQGTTWGATFSDEDLQRLAVNGQTMVYRARITAKSGNGTAAQSSQPVQFAVSAPPVSGDQG